MAQEPTQFSDDLELVQASQLGCRISMGKLIERHQREVRVYVRSRINDSEAALDLAQDVFVTAFVKFDQFDENRSLEAWFKGIAKHKILNYWRKKRAIPVGDIDALAALSSETLDSSAADERASDVLDALKNCLSKLSKPEGDLVRQRYLEAASVASLAEENGLKHSAVTMRLHRIRKQLHDCIRLNLETTT